MIQQRFYRIVLFFLAAFALTQLGGFAQGRAWKAEDKTIEGEFVEFLAEGGGTIRIRQGGNGEIIELKMKDLSEADQAYVRVKAGLYARGAGNRQSGYALNLVPPGSRYALLIGVNEYIKPITSLDFCLQDMTVLADTFKKIGFPQENVILMTDASPAEFRPTRANICRQIKSITALMGPDELLVVAFSGHGAMVGDKSYLLPSDANPSSVDTLVSRDWAYEQLDKCQALQKIFLVDACRNEGAFSGARAISGVKSLSDQVGARSHGFILIASCDKDQQSWENPDLNQGVFSYYFAQGLAGAAKDEDGTVSVLGLFQYVSRKTKMFVYRQYNMVQVPTLKQGGEMTDFYLAKLDVPAPPISVIPTASANPSKKDSPADLAPENSQPGDRIVKTLKGVEFAFRFCPQGEFTMGSSVLEQGRYEDERQHPVTISRGFWLMETEVTQAQWKAVMGDNPSDHKGDTLPVEQVSWDACQVFCQKAKSLGLPLALPSEAQWEYACRAGTVGPYADALDKMAWYTDNSGYCTHPVGAKRANAWGLFDMHGNVKEWCEDVYVYDITSNTTENVVVDAIGAKRVRRGGSNNSSAGYCRSAYRLSEAPALRNYDLGLRCLLVQ